MPRSYTPRAQCSVRLMPKTRYRYTHTLSRRAVLCSTPKLLLGTAMGELVSTTMAYVSNRLYVRTPREEKMNQDPNNRVADVRYTSLLAVQYSLGQREGTPTYPNALGDMWPSTILNHSRARPPVGGLRRRRRPPPRAPPSGAPPVLPPRPPGIRPPSLRSLLPPLVPSAPCSVSSRVRARVGIRAPAWYWRTPVTSWFGTCRRPLSLFP